ncbi:MAG: hypothetical protein ACYC0J_10265 [Gammaproteobacteria bacterium]
MNKKCKYNFYDIVKIDSNKPELKKVNGMSGVIRGYAQSEEDPNAIQYAVDVIDDAGYAIDGWCFFEEDLQPTDKKANPESFNSGQTVRVLVDPKTGKGFIPDKE